MYGMTPMGAFFTAIFSLEINELALCQQLPYDMKGPMALERLCQAQWQPGSPWSFGCPLMKLPGHSWSPMDFNQYPTRLFDLAQDSHQETPLADPAVESAMAALMARLMVQDEAPPEQ